jgi:hypothetical protein
VVGTQPGVDLLDLGVGRRLIAPTGEELAACLVHHEHREQAAPGFGIECPRRRRGGELFEPGVGQRRGELVELFDRHALVVDGGGVVGSGRRRSGLNRNGGDDGDGDSPATIHGPEPTELVAGRPGFREFG